MDKTDRRIAIKVNRDGFAGFLVGPPYILIHGLEEPYSRMSKEARLKFAAYHNSCAGMPMGAAFQELAARHLCLYPPVKAVRIVGSVCA